MDFHVGEYVELRDGKIGYISNVWPDQIVCAFPYNPTSSLLPEIQRYTTTDEHALRKAFKRIGCHNFELPPKKIEPIKFYGESISAKEFQLYKKINELSEAVNKINEQLKER